MITDDAVNGISDWLGPSDRRYLGQGYRRVRHKLSPLTVIETDPLVAESEASVDYPEDWSRKSAIADRQAHLSTVDAVILSALCAGPALQVRRQLSDDDLGAARIDCVDIRAGSTPTRVDNAVPIKTTFEAGSDLDGGRSRSLIRSQLGSLHTRTVISHPKMGSNTTPERPQPAAPGIYSDMFRFTEHAQRVSAVDPEAGSITVEHELEPLAVTTSGLESEMWPCVSYVDCIVIAGQMAQILVHAQDGSSRETTSNLWMRKASLRAHHPDRRKRLQATSTMHLTGRRVIARDDGLLHAIDVEIADLYGMEVKASLALRTSAED
ncbi:AvrD family protein [Microbacterium sp.]|uniref:AvrD family protein n=1 Tax=Microbacterium sp. TaxID=51671 RepID=UPI002733BAE0|nr:AvrD family protein [Microbacterium sp.]MDP3949527.1 AvrD family protein [Microbacterium sp.]